MVDFQSARRTMVEAQLRTRNVVDKRVLAAMGDIAREKFVPEDRSVLAYSDVTHNLDSDNNRVLSSPISIARLLQLAEIAPTDVVLDVACGSGYTTAVIARLACAVVGLEDDQALVDDANTRMLALEVGNAAIVKAPLAQGVPAEAPFNVIIVEGMVDDVSPQLFEQLAKNGRLVACVARNGVGIATVFGKFDGVVTSREEFDIQMPILDVFKRELAFSL